MSGGDIIAVALAVAVLGAGTVAFIVLLAEAQDWRREEEREVKPWGDVVEVPLELRLPGKMAGEGPSLAGEPLTGQVAHHDSAVDNL
jgi:hypothetical protein